jgi:N utilization substance protein A
VFITRALAPANIVKLTEVPGTQRVVVVINDENLAQAIGKNGQNVKLAATLVGRDLDVFGEKEWSEKDEAEKTEVMTPREQELRRTAHRAESLFANVNPAEETQETSGEEA